MENFNLSTFFDILAAVSFAATGALVASRKGLDVVGFMWLAVLTGVGGGTVRDLMLGAPVFWIENTYHIVACLLTALVIYLAAPVIESRRLLVLWFDALGLSFVAVSGTAKALGYGVGPLVAIVMGVVTGTVGGIIRDLVGHEPSIILKREVYVTAATIGAGVYVITHTIQYPLLNPAIVGFAAIFIIRGLAISFNWSLPGYPALPLSNENEKDEES